MGVGAVTAMAVTTGVLIGEARVERPGPATAPAADVVELTPERSAPQVAPPPGPPAAPAPEPSEHRVVPADPVHVSLTGIAPAAHYGIVVLDLETGEELFTELPDESFEAASVVKILVALDALDRGAPVADVTTMLATSSDTIANRYWRTAIPLHWADVIGLPGLVAPADPNRWGDTRMSARDVVAIYRHVLASPHSKTIVTALAAATALGEDGFDQTFGIPDGVGELSWAVKQGWACCNDDRRVLNTTGLVEDRYLVAVLTDHPRSTTSAEAARQVTALVSELTPLLRR
jgi:hypothetical protein